MAMTQRSTLNPLRDQFGSLFADLENALMSGGGMGMGTTGTTPAALRGRTTAYGGGVLSCDVCEKDDIFHVVCDIPGVPKDQINVSVDDTHNTINLSCERKSMHEKEEGWLLRERPSGRFSRTLMLPETCDLEKANVEFKDGMLCFTIPRREAPHARTLTIK